MCSASCKIVKEAVKAFNERGVCMSEFIDLHKEENAFCQLCNRNEKACMPEHLLSDMSIVS